MSQDPAERLMSGASWNEFCEMLKMAGHVVQRDGSPDSPLDRAEGYRYLARLVRAGLENFLEHSDPLAPVLHRPVHETVKMGADNPDNYYQFAAISGEHDYRIRGRRNTVSYLGFGTYAGDWGSGGRKAQTGYLEGKELAVEPDGTFEVLLSCQEQPGNWLPMQPDTASLIVRQTFLDREHEAPADVTIERLGGTPGPTPVTPERVDEGLRLASMMVGGAAATFAGWAEGFRQHTNELPRFEQTSSFAAYGDPNIVYYHSYWELEPDEALVVEVTPPRCDYWNFQLCNHWMESLDYRYHQVAINKHQARPEPDGSVRLVVAHRDPGLPNWLQTAGHRQGTMTFRWIRADEHPQPQTRVVKLGELSR
jgi:hypothetical protein